MTNPDEFSLRPLTDPLGFADPCPLYKQFRETPLIFKPSSGDTSIESGFKNNQALLCDSRVGNAMPHDVDLP